MIWIFYKKVEIIVIVGCVGHMCMWMSARYIFVDDMSLLKKYLCIRYICLKLYLILMFVDYVISQVVRETLNVNIHQTSILLKSNICIK